MDYPESALLFIFLWYMSGFILGLIATHYFVGKKFGVGLLGWVDFGWICLMTMLSITGPFTFFLISHAASDLRSDEHIESITERKMIMLHKIPYDKGGALTKQLK